MHLDALKQVATMIATTFAPHVETVIHDMKTEGFPILAIYNNTISGRKIGDATRIFNCLDESLDVVDTVHNYEFDLPNGKKTKSSSTIFKENSEYTYALTINFDTSYINDTILMLSQLTNFIPPTQNEDATLMEAVTEELVRNELYKALMARNLSLTTLSKSGLKDVILDLKKSGFLQRRKVVPYLSQILDVSRPTIYKYSK